MENSKRDIPLPPSQGGLILCGANKHKGGLILGGANKHKGGLILCGANKHTKGINTRWCK